MFENIAVIISVIALIISFVSLWLSYSRMKKTLLPAIEHKITDLPPYFSEKKETKIEIINVGNSIAKIDETWLNFSWNEDLVVEFDYEIDGVFYKEHLLAPNEKKIFYKKLPLPSESGTYKIKIVTCYNKCLEKTDEFPIEVKNETKKT